MVDAGSSRPLTVKCTNHRRALASGLWNFFGRKFATDCNFRLGGQSRRVHRVVMEIFLRREKLEDADLPNLGADDTKEGSTVDLVLEFLYTGQVTFPEERREELLKAAKELDFKIMVDAIENAGLVELESEPAQLERVVRGCRVNLGRRLWVPTTTTQSARVRQLDVQLVCEPDSVVMEPPESEFHMEWGQAQTASQSSPKNEFVRFGWDDNSRVEKGKERETAPDGDKNWVSSDDEHVSSGEGEEDSSEDYVEVTKKDACKSGKTGAGKTKPKKRRSSVRSGEGASDMSRSYKCSQCEFETSKRRNYNYHLKSVHQVNISGKPTPKIRCPECDHVAMYLSDIHRHQMARHPKKCPDCSLTFGQELHLRKHVQVAHRQPAAIVETTNGSNEDNTTSPSNGSEVGEVRLPATQHCSHCEYVTASKPAYRRHLLSAHGLTSRGVPAPVFRCDECNYSTTERKSLINHQVSKHPKTCTLCGLAFGRDAHLSKHMDVDHSQIHDRAKQSGEESVSEELTGEGEGKQSEPGELSVATVEGVGLPMTSRCPHCDFQTNLKAVFRRHLMSSHGVTISGQPAERHCCPEPGCHYSSMFQSMLGRHRVAMHDEQRPFPCPHCIFGANRKGVLRRHVEVAHGQDANPVLCDTCGKRCSSNLALALHNRSHSREKRLQCPQCDTSFATSGLLGRHLRLEHGLSVNRFVCESCGQSCSSSYALVVHQRTHTNERPLKCPVTGCPHATNQQSEMKRHVVCVHGLGPSRITCGTCGKRCGSPAELVIHMRKHTQEKNLTCPHCPHRTGHAGSLQKHIVIVHGLGVSRFTCDTCGKRCPTPKELAAHVRTHAKERPFKCPHCAEAFLGKVSLKKHLNVAHGVGSNRYACETCGEWCGSNTALTIHRRTHTNERPFKCHLCNYASIHTGNLNAHLKKKHKLIAA